MLTQDRTQMHLALLCLYLKKGDLKRFIKGMIFLVSINYMCL